MNVLSAELEAEVAARRASIRALRTEARRIENEPSGEIQHVTIPAAWVPELREVLEYVVECPGDDADAQVVNEMRLIAQAIRDDPAPGSSHRLQADRFEGGFCGMAEIWADRKDSLMKLDPQDRQSLTRFVLTEEVHVLEEFLAVFSERLP